MSECKNCLGCKLKNRKTDFVLRLLSIIQKCRLTGKFDIAIKLKEKYSL